MEKPAQDFDSADDRASQSGEDSGRSSSNQVDKKTRRRNKKKSGNTDLDRLPTGDVGGVAGQATNTVGDLGNKAMDKGEDGKDTLRLRLDLNLEVEIQLKARIKGDLELALLYVLPQTLTTLPLPAMHHDAWVFGPWATRHFLEQSPFLRETSSFQHVKGQVCQYLDLG